MIPLLVACLCSGAAGATAGPWPDESAPSSCQRFRILRHGAEVGSAWIERRADRWSWQCRWEEAGEAREVRGARSGGAVSFRPERLQWRLQRGESEHELVLTAGESFLEVQASEHPPRRYLTGYRPYAVEHAGSWLSWFALADTVARHPDHMQSFDVLDAATLERKQYEGRFVPGDESGARPRIEIQGGDALVQVEIGAAGDWRQLVVGAGAWTLESLEPPAGVTARSPGQEREAEVIGPAGVLRGTFLPVASPGSTRAPAALLLSGSGPHDRSGDGPDGSPPRGGFLRQIASSLGAAGIASLLLDDRGVGESEGVLGSASFEELCVEARAALRWLKSRPEVDPEQVFAMGHSEGAWVAAAVSEGAVGLVLIGAGSEPLPALLLEQTRAVLRVQGLSPARRAEAIERLELFLQQLDAGSAEVGPGAGWPGGMGTRAWWEQHRALDPKALFAALDVPVLLLSGANDLHVAPRHAELVERWLRGRNVPVQREVLAGLDHFLLPSASGDPRRALEESRRMPAAALEVLVRWCEERCRR